VPAADLAVGDGVLVRVDAVGEQTALAGIRRLVEQAQASGSRAQALADRAAGLVTVVVWLALGEPGQAVERTVTVLVIACPHALGLAIPWSSPSRWSGTTRWGRRGPARGQGRGGGRPPAPRAGRGHGRRRCQRRPRPGPAAVGIAIGAGIESAGIVLAANDPRGVLAVIRLSRASYRRMLQNLAWATGYNLVAVPVAAGALAWAGVTLGPAVGAILMSLSTIVVALNAQLLRRLDLQQPEQRRESP
jgi:cation transport ATPase